MKEQNDLDTNFSPKSMIEFIHVPFDEKDQVKNLGAKWHSDRRQWFIDPAEREKFRRWLIPETKDFNTRAICPFYLVESQEKCWKCEASSRVICFAAEGIESEEEQETSTFVLFDFTHTLPPRLDALIKRTYKRYFKAYSSTYDGFYMMNHCENCGAPLGDFYMHHEPDGAFFPDLDSAEHISLTILSNEGHVKLGTQSHFLLPDLKSLGAKIISSPELKNL